MADIRERFLKKLLHIDLYYPSIKQFFVLETLRKKTLENIMGKGENGGYQHFLLFPQCFLSCKSQIPQLKVTFIVSSANPLSLVQSVILLLDRWVKELLNICPTIESSLKDFC